MEAACRTLGGFNARSACAQRERNAESIFSPGGQRNPLKKLDSDKEIKGNQSFFLGKIWSGLGLALLGFDRFGENLAARSPGAARSRRIRLPNKP
jgi:hypothetical protein